MAISHFKLLIIFFFHLNLLLAVLADPVTPSFSFTNFDKDPNFGSTLSLYGDAKVFAANGPYSSPPHIELSSAGGQVMYKKPIKLLQGSSRDFTSFSTYFSFLTPPDSVLSLILVPSVEFNSSVLASNTPFGVGNRLNWTGIIAVEFGALNDAKYGDLEKGRFFSLKLRHYPSAKAMLSSGKRLHAWVDCSSNRLEVRLSESGEVKPVDPLVFAQIGFSRMWSMWSSISDEVMLGLSSSSSSNASESCFLYSWSFQMRSYPHWMHSQPLDPNGFHSELKPMVVNVRRGGDYVVMWVIAALILGVGCGAFGAFMGINLCTMFSNRRPDECSSSCSVVHPVDFDYEKVKVVVVEDTKVFEDHGKQCE